MHIVSGCLQSRPLNPATIMPTSTPLHTTTVKISTRTSTTECPITTTVSTTEHTTKKGETTTTKKGETTTTTKQGETTTTTKGQTTIKGLTTTITILTPLPCICLTNTASLFLPTGIPDPNQPTLEHSPSFACTGGTCTPSGTQECWTPGPASGDPNDFTTMSGFAYDTIRTSCANFCACDSTGVCYIVMGSPDSFLFAPFCDTNTGTCCMNVFIQAVSDNDGLVSTDGTKMFTNIGQIDTTTGNFFPFSCSGTEPYAIITAISCDGCSSIMSAMCTGTATVILH